MEFNVISLILSVVAFLVAISIHEFAHAWTANYLGDDTAKHYGRVSLNPIVHFDPIGSTMVIVSLFLSAIGIHTYLFGWGKPVPVNPNNFKNPQKDWALVSFAGPLSNIILATFLSAIIKISGYNAITYNLLEPFVSLNVFLAVFNLIPIPPLDGSKILYAFISHRVNIHQFEAAGPFILLFLIFSGTLQVMTAPLIYFASRLFGVGIL